MAITMRGLGWLGIYLGLVVAPMFLTLIGSPPGRGLWTELSVGFGFVAMTVLALQFAVTARIPTVESPFGLDAVLQFHRTISFTAVAFVVAHPVILVAEDPDRLRLLNPVTATPAARWGLASLALLLLLIAATVWRRRIGLPYEVWRVTHGLLAIGVIATAFLHMDTVGHYLAGTWQRFVWSVISAGVIAVLGYVRVVKPQRLRAKPYAVDRVDALPDGAWRLAIRPDGHKGLRFQPGQFAWLRVGRGPFSPHEHPFSFASSALDRDRYEFIIKSAGDFTSRLGEVEPGTRVYVDGPYGAFSYVRSEAAGFVFIAGGVGIAPIFGMLRSLADVEDPRPMTVLYANPTWDEVIGRRDLDELTERLDLRVVHVLEEPPEAWEGERGRIDDAVLDRQLPPRPARYAYFVCGPPAMIDDVEAALRRRRIPPERISAERFDLV